MADCEGCKERREKIVAAANAMIEWLKNPRGTPPLGPAPPLSPNKQRESEQ